MDYRTAVRRLGDLTGEQLLALYAAGQLREEDLDAAAVSLLLAAYARGAALGDAGLAAALGVDPVGAGPDAEVLVRLEKSVVTIRTDATDVENLAMRAQRLGKAVPMEAAQSAWHAGLNRNRRRVRGWTRSTSGDACELCVALANGEVLPVTAEMHKHPGCSCIATPVNQ